MNKIRVNGVKRVIGFNNRVEIKTDFKNFDKLSDMVILNEEDILNKNKMIKIRGMYISCLFIPRKFRYTFEEQESYDIIKPCLTKDSVISYY